MAEYRVVIDLVVNADNEEHAYNRICRMIGADQLSREVCEIELDDKEADDVMKGFDDAVIRD